MAMVLKRNTTPTIPIKINYVDDVDCVMLVFKNENSPSIKPLFCKKVGIDPNTLLTRTETGYIATVLLTTEETFQFRRPEVFVDIYPIKDNTVYNAGEFVRYEVRDTFLETAIKPKEVTQ
jgi:hypothetical protein